MVVLVLEVNSTSTDQTGHTLESGLKEDRRVDGGDEVDDDGARASRGVEELSQDFGGDLPRRVPLDL